jgi:Peptidase M10 serralysin C terminal
MRRVGMVQRPQDGAWPTKADAALDGAVGRALAAAPAPAPAALSAHGSLYTFTIRDPDNLVSASIEAQITTGALYTIDLIGRYVAWQGTLDFVVEIKPASALTWSDADGLLPSVAQLRWNGSAWVNATIEECLTGIDSDPAAPDAGCTIFLADDGTIKNYGFQVWFDPDPRFGTSPPLPAGRHDFIGIYTHEIVHALGFYQSTVQWQQMIETQNGISYFTGQNARAEYGDRVPFVAGTDHYGNAADPAVPIQRGLMYQYGNYELNRLDLGRIDLAILADLGHQIKTYEGLPVFELIDSAPNLAGTAGGDALYGDYHANALTGGGGNDRLFGGGGADRFVFTRLSDSRTEALRSDGHKAAPDRIADFVPGEDRIDLSAIDAIAGTAPNDAFAFIGTAAFTGAAGQLRYAMAGGAAHIFADVDGNGLADLHIVAVTPMLTAADFIL